MKTDAYLGLIAELERESQRLLEQLRTMTAEQWELPTPAQGWSVKDQVTHLAFFDDCTHLALTDADGLRTEVDRLVSGGMDFPDRIAQQHRVLAHHTALEWFGESRRQLLATFTGSGPKHRLPWFGPDMSVASSATARLMETWAHGQDIYDAIGVTPAPSTGLRSIAHLGVATFSFTFGHHGLTVPTDPVRVELLSPAGDLWSWGPVDAANRVTGPAEDFVLTVTQRRHWSETALAADGAVATAWLDIAQAFAGAPSQRARPAVRS